MAAYNFGNHEMRREHAARARARRAFEAGIDRLQNERRRLLDAVQQWDTAYSFPVEATLYARRIL